MNTFLIILGALAVVAGVVIYLQKTGKIKDADGDLIPDVIEDKVEEVKEPVDEELNFSFKINCLPSHTPFKSAENCLVTFPDLFCKIPQALTFPVIYSSITNLGSLFLKSSGFIALLFEQLVIKNNEIINEIDLIIFI